MDHVCLHVNSAMKFYLPVLQPCHLCYALISLVNKILDNVPLCVPTVPLDLCYVLTTPVVSTRTYVHLIYVQWWALWDVAMATVCLINSFVIDPMVVLMIVPLDVHWVPSVWPNNINAISTHLPNVLLEQWYVLMVPVDLTTSCVLMSKDVPLWLPWNVQMVIVLTLMWQHVVLVDVQ